jgi:GST-like protein
MSASTDITPIFGAMNAAKAHPEASAIFRDRLRQFFQVWNERLAQQKQAAGDEVTVADFSLYAGYWRTKGAVPAVVEGLPHLERWANAMAARPAIQRAVKF